MRDVDVVETREQVARFRVQRDDLRIFHAIVAGELAYDQFAIHAYIRARETRRERSFQCQQQSTIFGDVVGGNAQVLADLGDDAAIVREDDAARRGRTGIAACAAISIDDAMRSMSRRRRRAHSWAITFGPCAENTPESQCSLARQGGRARESYMAI